MTPCIAPPGLAGLAVLVLGLLLPQQQPELVSVENAAFVVQLQHAGADAGDEPARRVAQEALVTASATQPFAQQVYGEPPGQAAQGSIRLLSTIDEYLRIDRQLTGGNFAENLAFTSFTTRAAYIVLQPPHPMPSEQRAPEFSALSRQLVAHESAHVICYNRLGSYESHPTWYSEGAAIWVGEQTLIAEGWANPLEQEPYTAKSILLVQGLAERGRLPALSVVLGPWSGPLAFLSTHERYAVWGLAFRFLFAHSSEFGRVLVRARGLPAGRSFGPQLRELLSEELAPQRLGELDQEFREWIANLRPAWDERGRSLETVGDEWSQVAFPERPARAWRLVGPQPRRPDAGPDAGPAAGLAAGEQPAVFRLSGTVRARRLVEAGDAAELLIGLPDRVVLVIQFGFDGTLRVLRETPYAVQHDPLARALLGEPGAWTELEFDLTLERGLAEVGSEPGSVGWLGLSIDGRQRLRVDLRGQLPAGEHRWGLGVTPGVAVDWINVEAE